MTTEQDYEWLIGMLGTSVVVIGSLLVFMIIIYALGKLLSVCLNYSMARIRTFNEVRYYIVYRNEIRKWVSENKEKIDKDFERVKQKQ